MKVTYCWGGKIVLTCNVGLGGGEGDEGDQQGQESDAEHGEMSGGEYDRLSMGSQLMKEGMKSMNG